MTSRARKGFTEEPHEARAETEAELSKRGLRKRHEGNIVELVTMAALMIFARGFLAAFV